MLTLFQCKLIIFCSSSCCNIRYQQFFKTHFGTLKIISNIFYFSNAYKRTFTLFGYFIHFQRIITKQKLKRAIKILSFSFICATFLCFYPSLGCSPSFTHFKDSLDSFSFKICCAKSRLSFEETKIKGIGNCTNQFVQMLQENIRPNENLSEMSKVQIHNKIIGKMGAQCTRSYQAEANSFEVKRTLLKETRKTQKEIVISMLTNNRRNQGISGRNQKLVFSTKTLNSYISSCKFNPDTGFQNGPSQGRLMDNEVQFSLTTDTTRSNRLEIKGSDDTQLWRKVNSFGQELNEGDEMIIGNKIMKLKYVLSQNQISYQKEKSTIRLALCKEEDAECRFCLDKAVDDTNPLVMPCKCLGSVSAVHQKCLSNWVFNTSGSFQQTMPTFSFKIKHAECEICKFSFENYIWNRMMVVFSAFSGDYAIFQIKNDEPQKKQEKSKDFIIFKFGETGKKMTIGKSSNCDYQLNDQWISEINTTLSLAKGKLMIEDTDSKFGTFIKQSTRRLIPENSYKLGNLYFSVKNGECSAKGRKNQTLRY